MVRNGQSDYQSNGRDSKDTAAYIHYFIVRIDAAGLREKSRH